MQAFSFHLCVLVKDDKYSVQCMSILQALLEYMYVLGQSGSCFPRVIHSLQYDTWQTLQMIRYPLKLKKHPLFIYGANVPPRLKQSTVR